MKMRLTLESRNHSTGAVEAARKLIEDAARKAKAAPEGQRAALLQWLDGAVSVYSMVSGEDLSGIVPARQSGAQQPAPAPVQAATPSGMPEFKPGRSVPPPPRSPGAQRPVGDAPM